MASAPKPSGLRQPSAIKAPGSSSAEPGPSETPAGTGKGLPGGPMSRLPSASSNMRKKITSAGIKPPGSTGDSGLATDTDPFVIGDIVYVNGDATKRGKICCIGEVEFAKGDFAGVVLDLPIGNHDGIVQGKRYFQCAPNHGIFTKLSRLTRDPVADVPVPSTPQVQVARKPIAAATPPAPESISGRASVAGRTPSPTGFRTPVRTGSIVGNSLVLGERVIVASATGGTKIGILRYLGATDFAPGDWAGVELLTPMGKNNGSVGGKIYFNCKEKHGLFVPANKVISSPINKAPRRHGSRESLVSVSSLASSAASRSLRRPSTRDTHCLPTCSLQSVLSEKEKHVERLIKERELDMVDLANLSRQYEDKVTEVKRLQLECAGYQQQLTSSSSAIEDVAKLQNNLDEERRKVEDLQYTLDEEKIMKADLQAQLDGLIAKSTTNTQISDADTKEKEQLRKELEDVKSQLQKQLDLAKEGQLKSANAHAEIQSLLKKVAEKDATLAESNEKLVFKDSLMKKAKEDLTALKKKTGEDDESLSRLNRQLTDTKRREEELKDKVEKLEIELENAVTRKCALEAEVMDLANSRADTDTLLGQKIRDLTLEVHDLREKLQSGEENKIMLKRINTEFKFRIEKQQEAEVALKKSLDELSAKVEEEKSSLGQELNNRISALEEEKLSLEKEIKTRDEAIDSLRKKLSEDTEGLEKKIQDLDNSSQKYEEAIEKLKKEKAELAGKVSDYTHKSGKLEAEKLNAENKARQREEELKKENSKLQARYDKITGQIETTTRENLLLKNENEGLKADVSMLKSSLEEKSTQITSLETQASNLKKLLEEERETVAGLLSKVSTLKKDKSALKEQLSSYKTDSSRFEEVETALSQELLSLRSKLEQKNKNLADLEKELAEKKADIESKIKAPAIDTSSPQAHIDFLNSIIVDLQKKNEDLNVKVNVLVNGGGTETADSNSNRVSSEPPRPFQSLRSYCDICEKFDLHDTEECPTQASEENTHYGGNRGEARPYCETCEIFGHLTGECDDQETY